MLLCLIALSVLLAGCVLQSKTPLFAENDGKPLLDDYGLVLQVSSFVQGDWRPEDTPAKFVAEGKHYLAVGEKENTQALFVPLDDKWWVLQVSAGAKPAVYMLVEAAKDHLILNPLMCKELKANADAAKLVTFEGDDCFANQGSPTELFKKLRPLAGPALVRLEKRGR